MAWARARASLRRKDNRMHAAVVVVVAGLSSTMHAAHAMRRRGGGRSLSATCSVWVRPCVQRVCRALHRPACNYWARPARVARATRHYGDRIDPSPILISRKPRLAAVVIFCILNFKQKKYLSWLLAS
jgi:hypothetical protein